MVRIYPGIHLCARSSQGKTAIGNPGSQKYSEGDRQCFKQSWHLQPKASFSLTCTTVHKSPDDAFIIESNGGQLSLVVAMQLMAPRGGRFLTAGLSGSQIAGVVAVHSQALPPPGWQLQ